MKHMKELTDKFTAIGVPISEKDKVVILLGILPIRVTLVYTLMTVLEAQENMLLSYIQQSLIHEEQELNGELRTNVGQNKYIYIGWTAKW